jgi:hypothetical protein
MGFFEGEEKEIQGILFDCKWSDDRKRGESSKHQLIKFKDKSNPEDIHTDFHLQSRSENHLHRHIQQQDQEKHDLKMKSSIPMPHYKPTPETTDVTHPRHFLPTVSSQINRANNRNHDQSPYNHSINQGYQNHLDYRNTNFSSETPNYKYFEHLIPRDNFASTSMISSQVPIYPPSLPTPHYLPSSHNIPQHQGTPPPLTSYSTPSNQSLSMPFVPPMFITGNYSGYPPPPPPPPQQIMSHGYPPAIQSNYRTHVLQNASNINSVPVVQQTAHTFASPPNVQIDDQEKFYKMNSSMGKSIPHQHQQNHHPHQQGRPSNPRSLSNQHFQHQKESTFPSSTHNTPRDGQVPQQHPPPPRPTTPQTMLMNPSASGISVGFPSSTISMSDPMSSMSSSMPVMFQSVPNFFNGQYSINMTGFASNNFNPHVTSTSAGFATSVPNTQSLHELQQQQQQQQQQQIYHYPSPRQHYQLPHQVFAHPDQVDLEGNRFSRSSQEQQPVSSFTINFNPDHRFYQQQHHMNQQQHHMNQQQHHMNQQQHHMNQQQQLQNTSSHHPLSEISMENNLSLQQNISPAGHYVGTPHDNDNNNNNNHNSHQFYNIHPTQQKPPFR